MTDDLSLSLRARMALEKNGFRFTHSLGQNFLFDEDVLGAIAGYAGAFEGTNVLEIGPGAGMLTGIMAGNGANVVSVELDRNLEGVLSETVGGFENVSIVWADALKTDLDALTRERFGEETYVIAANLPYYITADFLEKAVELKNKPVSITVMLQKEAAQRVMSVPGDKDWCALAAILSFYCTSEAVMDVPADLFTPKPHVDSRLVRFELKDSRVSDDEKGFVNFIKAAFLMRRKTLANNLVSVLHIPREQAEAAITSAGFDARVRGEALELTGLASVYELLAKR